MRMLLTLLAILVPVSAWAQVPGTDLYLVPLADGVPAGAPVNLTARAGYDNQPAFLPGSDALRYTRIDAQGQADVWLVHLDSREAVQLTDTATSEYSPLPVPESDRFSVVRVEPDSTQRVWSFAADGSDPQLALPDLPGVGYHCWGAGGDVILFVLGTPHELRRVRPGTSEAVVVATDIGRCLARIPGQSAFSFVRRDAEGALTICRLGDGTGGITPIAPTPDPLVEDYCWTPDGRLWSSDGTALLEWAPAEPGRWRRVHDFRSDGIQGISRLAVSPDGAWLVFAAADAPAGNR